MSVCTCLPSGVLAPDVEEEDQGNEHQAEDQHRDWSTGAMQGKEEGGRCEK